MTSQATAAAAAAPAAGSTKKGQNLDLSPQDLKKYLSQPVRAIFHEQAKSIVAIQVRLL